MTIDDIKEWIKEANEFKRIATSNFGAQCDEHDEDCMVCMAHKLANINIETAESMLRHATLDDS